MKDPAFVEYVEAIERVFRVRLGREHVLSPRDFALARSWHRAGFPVSVVVRAVEQAFAREPSVSSLAYCRSFVEALAAEQPLRPSSPPAVATDRVPPRRRREAATFATDLRERLRRLAARLEELRPGPMACFEPPLRRADELSALLEVAAKPNWDYVQATLRRIDDDVSAAISRSLASTERSSLREEVAAAASSLPKDGAGAARVVDAALDARLRERLRLPRLA